MVKLPFQVLSGCQPIREGMVCSVAEHSPWLSHPACFITSISFFRLNWVGASND